MKSYDIPFNRPARFGEEIDYIRQCLENGKTSGDGPFTRRASERLATHFDEPELVLLTTSCTDALEMTGVLLEIGTGDEVIVPSFTFVSAALAYVSRGATPIFCDVRPDTLNIDETKLARLITPRTKAIVVVHYAGIPCDMDAILEVASVHGIPVVEDNAHGLFGSYKNRPLGSLGTMACHSFHETKNMSCGEGGALVLNRGGFGTRAEVVREKGTNRSRFFRGEVDKYTWVDYGSSYLPSDILAAALLAQLEHADEVQRRRRGIFQAYETELAGWRETLGARGPVIPEGSAPAWHMYYMLMPSLEVRSAFIAHMKSHSVLTVFHYLPLHLSRMGRQFGGAVGQCPTTEDVADRLVRMPMFFGLTDDELDRVFDVARAFST